MGAGTPGWSSRAVTHVSFAEAFRPQLGFYFRMGTPRYAAVPLWAITVLFLLPAALSLVPFRKRIARRRATRGLCPACGYDLRATPGRCPECGGGAFAPGAVPA